MKYVCKQTCQHRDQGQIYFCEFGEVYDFEDKVVTSRFQEISEEVEKYKLDFTTASEEELKAAKWTLEQASVAIKEVYNIELNTESGTKKSDIIKQILDARFRAVDNIQTAATEGQ